MLSNALRVSAGLALTALWLLAIACGDDPEEGPMAPYLGQWQIETVDSFGLVGDFTSLTLDAAGLPHISYIDGTNHDLDYARSTGTGWELQPVDGEIGGSGSATYTSLVLDADGRPHIAYRDFISGALKYASWDGTAWRNQTVDTVGNAGRFCSLAIDAWGHPHIAYTAGSLPTEQVLRYAMSDNLDWFIEEPYPSLNIEGTLSIAVDSFARPMIAVHTSEFAGSRLMFGVNTRQGWIFETVDTVYGSGAFAALALDHDCSPVIAYHSLSGDDLRLAVRGDSTWVSSLVDSLGAVGKYVSLAIDSLDRPHIAYFDEDRRVLKYAVSDGSRWFRQTVDPTEGTGYYTSIAVDAERRPHISYFDAAHFDLRYASMR